jgi:membrane fusion protein, multidrug efflux system
VKIPLHAVGDALVVPLQAVQIAGEGKGSVLLVNSQNQIEQRSVNLGLQTANEVEIASGLQEGDLVVFGEQAQLKPGQSVSPKVVEPPSAE